MPAQPPATASETAGLAALSELRVLRSLTALPHGAPPLRPAAAVQTSDFCRLITFVGSAPLAQRDCDRIRAAVRDQARSHPNEVENLDRSIRAFFIALESRPNFAQAGSRETLRFALETLPHDDVLRDILDRSDPVVAVDAAHRRIVTEATLTAWRHANEWAAGLLSAPPADARFIAAERAELKVTFASLPAERADAIFHLERNREATQRVLDQARPAKRAAYLRASRAAALDAKHFPLRLADTMEQAYEMLVKQREPFPCLDRANPGADPLTPDLLAACAPQ